MQRCADVSPLPTASRRPHRGSTSYPPPKSVGAFRFPPLWNASALALCLILTNNAARSRRCPPARISTRRSTGPCAPHAAAPSYSARAGTQQPTGIPPRRCWVNDDRLVRGGMRMSDSTYCGVQFTPPPPPDHRPPPQPQPRQSAAVAHVLAVPTTKRQPGGHVREFRRQLPASALGQTGSSRTPTGQPRRRPTQPCADDENPSTPPRSARSRRSIPGRQPGMRHTGRSAQPPAGHLAPATPPSSAQNRASPGIAAR